MNIQDLEEANHGDGYANEHQRQFAHECSQREPRSQALIDALNENKFCVVVAGPDYCPHTDAIMGQKESLCSSHNDREAAGLALQAILTDDEQQCDDFDYYILPLVMVVSDNLVTDGGGDDDPPF